MNVLARSVGNAFRNKVRSGAVVIILAVAIGLALSMLVANQAVAGKITELKSSAGNALTINPAGARGFQGGGEPLTTADAETAAAADHVSAVIPTLAVRLGSEDSTAGTSAQGSGGFGPGGGTAGTTSLESAVVPGTLGNRQNQSGAGGSGTDAGAAGTARPAFTLPVTATGIGSAVDASGQAISITSGSMLTDFKTTSTQALIGTGLAEKNKLAVGDTFTALERKFTVAGIFDAGTAFDNNAVYLPLAAVQKLAGQTGELSTITAVVDSIDNMDSAQQSLTAALGDGADVSAGSRGLDSAVDSLASVQKISLTGFIVSLVTAGLIILLVMVMIVRERRHEIGVLKAIGAPNRTIGVQFVFESLVLVILAAVLGTGVAAAGSSGIAGALVSSGTASAAAAGPGGPDGGFGGPGGGGGFGQGTALIGDLAATLGPGTLALGLLAVLLVAVLGSLVPALLTAKIRPIEVLRGE
ncbi:FtsX-like permease family protein [Arthrobacter sp. I2-34]|uniref:FtsX-like permease family protein n=1 Tax=Arthrobacter hankyongi TaxID=2904801 RepID=A0ABS9L220_9MICC|nr:FtsX-like permease family protein [Arthrobacter hankyongi]MCG2620680.1 FtsX-like permease family protein [Arthrobacter hankyongi]